MADRTTVSQRYLELIRAFRLRPIADDAMLGEATRVAHSLARRGDLAEDEEEYLEVFCDLIEAYEAVHYPIDDVSGPDMLRFLIEQRGMSQAELADATGLARSTISEILNGKRGFGRKHLEAFSAYFRVDPGAFLPNAGAGAGPPAPGDAAPGDSTARKAKRPAR